MPPTPPAATPPLRSRNWFAPKNLDGFMHRSYLKSEGFSDAVFDQIAAFATGRMAPDHWVGEIRAVQL